LQSEAQALRRLEARVQGRGRHCRPTGRVDHVPGGELAGAGRHYKTLGTLHTDSAHTGPKEVGTGPAAEHETVVGFHRGGNTAEIAGFAALAGAMVLVALLILWFPWKERHA
ncbi:MAG: hypothetical protein ACE5IZ_10755, partial [Dehalococcoidia bacterium]